MSIVTRVPAARAREVCVDRASVPVIFFARPVWTKAVVTENDCAATAAVP
jgi:hypothetical protein